MQKIIATVCIISCLIFIQVRASVVNVSTAKKVGKNFYYQRYIFYKNVEYHDIQLYHKYSEMYKNNPVYFHNPNEQIKFFYSQNIYLQIYKRGYSFSFFKREEYFFLNHLSATTKRSVLSFCTICGII